MHIQGGFSKVYNQQGVDNFYKDQGSTYSNPHKYDIQRLLRKKLSKPNPYIKKSSKILDLACGSGQITIPLLSYGYKNIIGTDPYTYQSYLKNTKIQCDKYSFMDILDGCYQQNKFDCIICSYAMHLIKQSLLHDFCNKISEMSEYLIIISPHKLPAMKQSYGWEQVEDSVLDKIHFRVFKSYNYVKNQEIKQQKQQENIKEKQQNKQEEVKQKLEN